MDSGITDAVYGVDPSDNVYTRKNGNWKKIAGKLTHVSSGKAGTWAVNRAQRVFYLSGGRWIAVSGSLSQIDSGPSGIVCGVTKSSLVYCRKGITSLRPGYCY